MSRRTSAQPPRQKPARSAVMATGRPAGDSRANRSGTRPSASAASSSGRRTPAPAPRPPGPAGYSRSRRARRQADAPAAPRPAAARGAAAAGRAGSRAGRAAPGQPAATCRASCGASHSAHAAVSASSDRSGQPSSGSSLPHQRDPCLELARGIGPGQRPQSLGRDRARQCSGDIGRLRRLGAVASTSAPSRRRRRASTAPDTGSKLVSTCSVMRSSRQSIGIERRGQPDTRRRLQLQRGDRQQRRAGQRIGARQPRAAAAGQPEAARLAAPLRDAVRETPRRAAGRDRHRRGASARSRSRRRYWAGDAADARQRAAIGGRIAVRDRCQAQADIRWRVRAAQRIALLQQRGEIGRERRLARRSRGQHHRRQPRMRAKRRHPPAGFGDAAVRIERAEFRQQRGCRGQGAPRRRVEKWQIAPAACPRRRSPAPAPTAPPPGSRAGRRRAARDAAPRTRAGSRHPAPRVRRGQPAARRPRAKCAASPAGSGRWTDPAVAPAASRHPPRSARRARSARSRRSRSPAPPAAPRPAAARDPVRPAAGRRATAAPARRSPPAPPGCGGSPPCRAGSRGCRRHAPPARLARRAPSPRATRAARECRARHG